MHDKPWRTSQRAKELDSQLRIVTIAAKLPRPSHCTLLAYLTRLCSTLPHCPMPRTSDSARDTNPSGTGAPPQPPPNSYRDSTLGIFALLLAFRIVNALTLRTFFQPDEFFQSLEPAWQLAFGADSNAWITWVNSPFASHIVGCCLTMSRSGERNCGRPCILRYLQPSIESRQISQTSAA
jgi:hypothetical protein